MSKQTLTADQVQTMKSADLVATYNKLAGKAIKAFHTRTKGVAAVLALLQASKPAAAAPAVAPTAPSALGNMAATLNPADAEEQTIAALRKAAQSSSTKSAAPKGRSSVAGHTITATGKADVSKPGSLRAALMAAVISAKSVDAVIGTVVQGANGKPQRVAPVDVQFAAAKGYITLSKAAK